MRSVTTQKRRPAAPALRMICAARREHADMPAGASTDFSRRPDSPSRKQHAVMPLDHGRDTLRSVWLSAVSQVAPSSLERRIAPPMPTSTMVPSVSCTEDSRPGRFSRQLLPRVALVAAAPDIAAHADHEDGTVFQRQAAPEGAFILRLHDVQVVPPSSRTIDLPEFGRDEPIRRKPHSDGNRRPPISYRRLGFQVLPPSVVSTAWIEAAHREAVGRRGEDRAEAGYRARFRCPSRRHRQSHPPRSSGIFPPARRRLRQRHHRAAWAASG